MKITFKDVGQGDSILIEWQEGVEAKIGIIDCNKLKKRNPVLEYLVEKKYGKIEFAVLSHPHRDHYSGYHELITHCLNEGIEIKVFYHTVRLLDQYYWNFFEVDTESKELLRKMIQALDQLYHAELTEYAIIDMGTVIPCGPNGHLKSFSPSRDEENYVRALMEDDPNKNKSIVSHSANYLSSVFILEYKDIEVLLTSDAVTDVFQRLLKDKYDLQSRRDRMAVCQIPHHGSVKNYHEIFWQNMHSEGAVAIASAGIHGKYNHPDFSTLESMHGIGYSIHSTNFVNGVREFFEAINDTSVILDTVSDLEEDFHHFEGDQSYDLDQMYG